MGSEMNERLIEKEISREYKFNGRIFKVAKCKASLSDGTVADREVVCHSGGVCILPVDEDMNGYFVRQYRYGAEKVLVEIPAGKLEYGEIPLEAALRELSEETGFEAAQVISLGAGFSSPAIMTEKIYMYLALGLKKGKQHLDENEYLDVIKIPLRQMYEAVISGEIEDFKTQLAVLKSYDYLTRFN